MHSAFEFSPILEWRSLPFQIESMDTYGTKLLIGTSKGQLLVYSIPKQKDVSGRFKVELQETKKGFSRKSIVQLTAVHQFNLLLSLSDGFVMVHDLSTFQERPRLEKSKGCHLYAVDVQDKRDPTADSHRCGEVRNKTPRDLRVRLAVSVRRKIIVFEWVHQHSEFREVREYTLPDQPKVIAWAGDNIIAGLKKEYVYLNGETGECSEIWKTGLQVNQEPILSRLPGNEFLLSKDNLSIFIGLDSKPTRNYGIKWDEHPLCVDLAAPYAIALTGRDVEVRTVDSGSIVQHIDLDKAKFMCQGDAMYIAAPSNCWRIESVPLSLQIRDLLALEEYEEALNLAERVDEEPERKRARISNIKKSYAFAQFNKKDFEKAMKTFAELDIDPEHVIGLFPGLLPSEIGDRYEYPTAPPVLEGVELETALSDLVNYYLTQKRSDIQKQPEPEDQEIAKRRNELCETIDTTLLKCYLQTNPALVGPLLRVPNNRCSVTISETLLKRAERFEELVMLYKNRGLHRRALELLYKHGQRNGKLKGHYKTMLYLQRLGPKHFDLILEFSKWVFSTDHEDGLAIFTSDDYPEIAQLPRGRVLQHLKEHAPFLVVEYLEHIIFKWESPEPEFHNSLLQVYLDLVMQPAKEYLAGLNGTRPAPPGSEPGELGKNRTKLLKFLKTSKQYTPQKMISRFLDIDGLYEERALLLGRIGRHDQALDIYAHKLNAPVQAEEYCKNIYDPEDKDTQDVFLSLLQIYLKPPKGGRTNVKAALGVLKRHYDRVDTTRALDLLPTTTKVSEIHDFLTAVLRKRFAARRQGEVLKNLLKAERLQTNEQLLYYQAKRITIDDDKLCLVCRKPIRTSAFHCYPNGAAVHLYCAPSRDMADIEQYMR
eukprot:m.119447 g.119447  ORF g.119447 m.119447 type:complete len:879 (+) comp14318_c0_seq1:145-2781(+)